MQKKQSPQAARNERNDNAFFNKQLPCNLEAERFILGAILLNNQTITQAAELLTCADFFLHSHQYIYSAMLQLKEQSRSIDPITLQDALRRAGQLELIGGASFIGQLIDGVPRFSNIEEYSRLVLERSVERNIVQGCAAVQSQVFDDVSAYDALVNLDKLILEQRARLARQQRPKTLAGAVNLAIEELRDIQNGKVLARYQTGFTAIDKALGGGIGSKYVLIGARTSKGKSTIALQFALQGARLQPDAVGAIFSLEMNARELGHRVLNIATGIEDKYYKAARFTQDERATIIATRDELTERKIEVHDNPELTPSMFLAAALNAKRTHGRLDYAIVDYLALMEPDGRSTQPRYEKIVEISRRMKVAQMVLDCPVITPVQLKPQADTSERDLQLTDVAEADALVRDADIVFLLQAGQDEGAFIRYKLDAAKVRGGRLFTTHINFNKLCGRFESAALEDAAITTAHAYDAE